ncbi:protein LONGIFOLIA 2-like [Phalaenopsis equestris]|uniref:protein LONGIFOLIA 2-like n=1 Tax=Phalaenopsis equestris TaxID=78828 RepID=UPI0009E5B7F3|nr:protein LONGIFOLIA 2-like [Phalaenopsis equestris]
MQKEGNSDEIAGVIPTSAAGERKMMPGIGVVRGVPSHRKYEEQMERQMGCMTGFIQLLDPHQILTGRRFQSTKRLPSPLAAGSTSPSGNSGMSTDSVIKDAPEFPFSPSPIVSPENHVATNFPGRYTLPLPVFEIKDGVKASWKLPEAPRLSLDSRANVNAKGKLSSREMQASPAVINGKEVSEDRNNQEKQRRSPSVVARLMGLEELPIEELPKRPELRRSASESRVTLDPLQFNLQNPFPMPSEEDFRLQKDYNPIRSRDTTKPDGARQSPGMFLRKSFDAQEFFPEAKQVGSHSGEVEKRLRMRGIEEPARDLDTLKQILEALQLKGLLHSKQPEQQVVHLNDFYDRLPRSSTVHPPIVVIKPAPKPPPRLAGSESPTLHSRSTPPRRIPDPDPPPTTSLPDRLEIDHHFRNAGRRSPKFPEPILASRNPRDPPSRRRPQKDEGQTSPLPPRRIPAAHSPKSSPKKLGFPPKHRRPNHISPKEVHSTAEDDTSTTLSDTSKTSHFDFERAGNEDYSSGRRLLERCDKLLHSIAAITSSVEQVIPTDRQRSPVSVLDSCFLSDEGLASSLPNRPTGFTDELTDWREEHSKRKPTSAAGSDSPSVSHEHQTTSSNDQHEDYAFVLDVLRQSDLHPSADEAFTSIENRHRSSTTTSSTLHRRLIFDTVTELLNRKRDISPWDTFSGALAATCATSHTRAVWDELCQIQVRIPAANAMEATCNVIRKEMTGSWDREQGWVVFGEEMSEAVLHIERLVFKDLVADTIRELADLAGRCRRGVAISRRKIVF